MFKPTLLSTENKRSWTWPQLFIVVMLLLGGIHIYRVNYVRPVTPESAAASFRSTAGIVIEGPVFVEAGGFLPFKMDFNSRVNLKGRFYSGSRSSNVDCLLLREDDFELWQSGKEYKAVSQTGYVPGGKIVRVLEPGTFYLVFDNRKAGEPEKTIDTHFEVE